MVKLNGTHIAMEIMQQRESQASLSKFMLTTTHLITVSPEILSGMPVFKGTRVPVKTLFDHIEAGDSLDVFLG